MKAKPMQIAILPFDGTNVRYKALCPKCKTILEGGWMFIRPSIPKHESRDFYCSRCGQKIDVANTESAEWGEKGTDYDRGGYCPY